MPAGGEVAALRPIDVDLDSGEIHVRRVVLEVSKKITGADKVWSIRDYPKDNEHRTIRIGDQQCRHVRDDRALAAFESVRHLHS